MVGNIGVHGADDANIIDAGAYRREDLADLQAGLAAFPEGEGRLVKSASLPFGAQPRRRRPLAMLFGEFGFGVEGVDLAGAAIHEQVNDMLGAGPEVGGLGGERVGPHAHGRAQRVRPGIFCQ